MSFFEPLSHPRPDLQSRPPVYQALLTRRYLTSKVMPLLAAVAVTLCVAMELIVWSVMGGFKTMLEETGRSLIGDVSISYSHTGFGYYQDLIKRLEADPMVEAATPTIESFGLVSMPLGGSPETVILKGIDGPGFDRVTGYRDALWWKPLTEPLPKDKEREDPRLNPAAAAELKAFFDNGLSLTAPPAAGPGKGELQVKTGGRAALVVGTEVGSYNERMLWGGLRPLIQPGDNIPVMLRKPATLSVLPMDIRGHALPGEQKTVLIPIVNQFRSGLFEIDANTVLMRLDALQRFLLMDEAQRPDPNASGGMPVRKTDPKTGREYFDVGPAPTVTEPARVTNVLVRARKGISADSLKERCRDIYDQFARAHQADVLYPPPVEAMRILTWRDRNRTLLDAVENETSLVLFIFGIISLTSVFLILAIFWAMISEKTRDIGILRAIGAGRGGVAWIWIRYGLTIGVAGAALGGTIAWLVVTNINPIHEWLGAHLGIVIWNPKVYYFTTIPNHVGWDKAIKVMISGVVASVIGALIPAVKAARMDPVKALRWE